MPNKVYLDPDGIINQVLEGEQSADTIREVSALGEELTQERHAAGHPVRVIVDLTACGNLGTSARTEASKAAAAGSTPYRVDLFGNSLVMKNISNLFIRATGRANQIRYFNDRNAAVRWLKKFTT